MSRIKLSIAVLAAVLVVGAVASTAAFALTTGWVVGGTNLPANSKVALMTKGIVHLFGFEIPAGTETIKITCKEIEGEGAEFRGISGGFAKSLVFSECEIITTTTKCELATKTASTQPLLITEITLDGPLGVQGNFKPETKTIFATIKFNGLECGIAGVQPVTGAMSFLAPLGQDEMTWQPVLILGNLKVGPGEAKLHTLVLLATANLVPWSYL